MIRKLLNLLLLITIPATVFGQFEGTDTSGVSLLFIGDIMGHDEQIWSAEDRQTHTYSYDDVFQYIKPVISDADLAIANFEVTLAGPPYSGYPQFSSPAALAAACRNAGIDCLVTANNHAADKGKRGIDGTIARLDSLGIQHTGTFVSSAARDSLTPLILVKKGWKFAVLNYTFSTNGITVPSPCIVNMLEKEVVANDIAKAKNLKPDAVILFLHWGTEYDTVPSAAQRSLAAFFLDRGADIIIGSHPHVVQRMEWVRGDSSGKDKPVFYSLGNFVSNQRRSGTDGGAMVRITMREENGRLAIADAGYCLTWVYAPIVNYRKKFYILPCEEYAKMPGFFANPADYQKMNNFIRGTGSMLRRQNINVGEIFPASVNGSNR